MEITILKKQLIFFSAGIVCFCSQFLLGQMPDNGKFNLVCGKYNVEISAKYKYTIRAITDKMSKLNIKTTAGTSLPDKVASGKCNPSIKSEQPTATAINEKPPIEPIEMSGKTILALTDSGKHVKVINYKENAGLVELPGIIGPASLEANTDRVSKLVTNATFIIRSTEPLKIYVSPKTWQIVAGQYYTVTASSLNPFSVKALKNGILSFNLPATPNATVLVEPYPGKNLIRNSSFEDDSENAQLKYWTLSIPCKSHTISPSSDYARTGTHSIKIDSKTTTGSTGFRTSNPIHLEPGKEYIFAAYYYLENLKYGSFIRFSAQVRSPNKKKLSFRDYFINPPIYTAKNEWRRAYVRFAVPEDYTDATAELTISAEGAPFTSYWDDISLSVASQSVEQREWQMPFSKKLTTNAEIDKHIASLPVSKAQVVRRAGRPILEVNNIPIPNFDFVQNRWVKNSYKTCGLMEEAGIGIQWVPVWLNAKGKKTFGSPIWLGDGKYDFQEIDRRIRSQLQWAPNAKIMLDIQIWPYPEFGDVHPDSIWTEISGKRLLIGKSYPVEADTRPDNDVWAYSLTAPAFRDGASDLLREMGKHIASSPLGKSVIGINMIAGGDGQWLYWKKRDKGTFDYSAGAIKSFRNWLKRRYNNVEKLQKAWNDPSVTFESAKYPKIEDCAPKGKYFFDLKRDMKICDALLFMSEGVAETICQLAQAYKDGVGRPSIVTTYYHDIMSNSISGHNSLQYILERPAIDGIVSLVSYGGTRDVGRTGGNVSLMSSIALHNKIYIQEMDYRTEFANLWGDAHHARKAYGVPPGNAWIDQLRRDFGAVFTKGLRGWIFDIGQSASLGPDALKGLKEIQRVAKTVSRFPVENDNGQIAVFCDEMLGIYTTGTDTWQALGGCSHKSVRSALLRSGLSWDPYLLSDLENPARPSYKVNIFLSGVSINPEQIKWIKKNLQKDGRVLVFVNAAGYAMGNDFEKNIRELTGMTVLSDMTKARYWSLEAIRGQQPQIIDPEEVPWSKEVPWWKIAGPLFYVNDPAATPIAKVMSTDKVGMAVRHFKNWTSVYISIPGAFTPCSLRNIAALAGITPIGPANDVTLSGNGLTVIHALSPGEKELKWNEKYDLEDLTTRKIVKRKTKTYKFFMKATETRWFRRIPAQ